MKLTHEKDTSNWEILQAFHIVKRDAMSDRGEIPGETIAGELNDFELELTADEKGGLARAVLTRCHDERYAFEYDAESSGVIAEANNSSQFLDAMLHNAAVHVVNPDVTWR